MVTQRLHFRYIFRSLVLGILIIPSAIVIAEPSQSNQDVTLEKVNLDVLIADDVRGRKSRIDYFVKHNKKDVRIKFKKAPQGLRTGMKVTVKGKLENGVLTVSEEPRAFRVASTRATAGVGGVRQVVVLKIKSATSFTSATDSAIAGALNSMDTWYQESSFNQLSMKNDLQGDGIPDIYTVTIPDSTAGVAESSAFTFCRAAQTNASSQLGVNTSLYNHVICVIPPDMNYTWFGTAYIGGREIVISGKYAGGYPGGYTHEVGHNLGLHHSNTPTTEYGESACVMGGNAGTGRRDFNGPHKSQLNWLPVSTVTPGTFVIDAVEAQNTQRTSDKSVIKLRDPIANQDIWVSYRAPLGSFGPGLNTAYRTSIHSYAGGSSKTIILKTLGDGESFTQNGINVSQVSHTNTTATISISAACVRAAPTLTVSPTSSYTGTDQSKALSISIKNNDSNCSDAVIFSLTSLAPTGWNIVHDSSTVSLAAGQTAATSVTAIPPLGVVNQVAAISVSANAAEHAVGTGNASVTVDGVAPSAVTTLLAKVSRKSKVTLTWSASTDVGSRMADYLVYQNGVLISTTTGTTLNLSPGRGTFAYTVVARDLAGNKSLAGNTSAVTLTQR